MGDKMLVEFGRYPLAQVTVVFVPPSIIIAVTSTVPVEPNSD
jgi:hypothetical protein